MLHYLADLRALAYLAIATALLLIQWNLESWNPYLWFFSLFISVGISVIAHNHNHTPMWKSKAMNALTDYWLTLFYGFPTFAWVPTHNRNHHKFNNKEGDYTITYRYSENNNLLTLLSYPSISSFFQQKPISDHLKAMWQRNKSDFFLATSQYVVLGVLYAVVFWLDWQKALLYVVIPHQVALFTILIFNYVQHVHADEESKYNHSRNFVGPMLNILLFNNGYHTIHHLRANIHWSKLPEEHAKIEHLIVPELKQRSFWGYMIKSYVLAPFAPSVGTKSMRLERIGKQ